MNTRNLSRLGQRYGERDVQRLADQVVHLQGQVRPVDLNGQTLHPIERDILAAEALDKAAADLRYDTIQYIEPERIEPADIPFFDDDEVIPETVHTIFNPREEMIAVLSSEKPQYKSDAKKAQRKASEAFEKQYGLTDKEKQTVENARQLVQKQLDMLGAVGLGATAATYGTGFVSPDDNPNDNVQDALVAAALLGIGGVSGHHVAANSYTPQLQRIADKQHHRGLEQGDMSMYEADGYVKPLTNRRRSQMMADDARHRAARGRTGMAVGAGAGALLGLIQAINEDNQ